MANDPELKTIVQRMIDAGETDDAIGSVITRYNESKLPPYKGPDTFWGGVGKSITSGEALGAGMEGAKGWVKGAINLPGAIAGGLETIGNLATDPVGTIKSIPEGIGNMWETTKQAGSNPDAFGQMMGQTTGLPLVTRGVVKAAPTVMKAAAPAVEGAGRIIKEHRPISGAIPNMARMRTADLVERLAGRGIENIGKRMGRRTVQGEEMFERPPFMEGEVIPPAPSPVVPPASQIPPSVAPKQLMQPGIPSGPPPPNLLSSVTPGEPAPFPRGTQLSPPREPIITPPPVPKQLPAGPERVINLDNPPRKMLGTPMSSEAPSPTRFKQVFDQKMRRFNELKAKNQKGNLTPEELREGVALRKWLRGDTD